jgi:hypothetical protein
MMKASIVNYDLTLDLSWTLSISNTHVGGSPLRIRNPLVAKYHLGDLLEYSVSTS